jgi:hypothetical protein
MKSRYSIILGAGIVSGIFLFFNGIFATNSSLVTNLFVLTLLAGGYMVTYTSNIGKTRIAIFSGVGVGLTLIIYQAVVNKTLETSLLTSYLLMPAFFMMIGGFTAKLTKHQMDEVVRNLFKRKHEETTANMSK